jgi:hypothetical protein
MAAGAACTSEGTGDGVVQRRDQVLPLQRCCCRLLLQLKAVVLVLLPESCMVALAGAKLGGGLMKSNGRAEGRPIAS